MMNQDNGNLAITIGHLTPAGLGPVTVKRGDDVLLTDRFNLLTESARQEFIKTLCGRFSGIDAEQRRRLEADLTIQAARLADAHDGNHQPTSDAPDQPDAAALLVGMPAEVLRDADAMLADPGLLQVVVDDVAAIGIAGECELAATIYMVGVSRLLVRPLTAIVQEPSSGGKSFIIDLVASLLPPECVIHATSMTPQALYHMPPGALSHKFVAAGERSRLEDDDRAEATRALREMLSSGKLTKLIPEKDENGKIVTQAIEQAGPIAYIESTTLTKIFEEDANRCLSLQIDERPEQTRRILHAAAQGYADGAGIDPANVQKIVQRHHALQRMLKSVPVAIPYAMRLAGRVCPVRS